MDRGISASADLMKHQEEPAGNTGLDETASDDGLFCASTGSPPPPQKIYVLCYDARDFEYDGENSEVLIPKDNHPVHVVSDPEGILGVYHSKTRAMIAGREWAYDQLRRISPQINLPLPRVQWNEFPWSPAPEGTWRCSGWKPDGLNTDAYEIVDKGTRIGTYMELCLVVRVYERDLNEEDPEEEYMTDEEGEEDADAEEGEGQGDNVPAQGHMQRRVIGVRAPTA